MPTSVASLASSVVGSLRWHQSVIQKFSDGELLINITINGTKVYNRSSWIYNLIEFKIERDIIIIIDCNGRTELQ